MRTIPTVIKLLLISVSAVGVATSVFGQGVFMSNAGNTGGPTATADGQVYIYLSDGFHLVDLYNNNLGVDISAGLTSSSLSPLGLGTYTAATDPKGYTGYDLGQFYLGPYGQVMNIPGAAPGQVVWIELNVWFEGPIGGPDLFSSFAAAAQGGGLVGSVLFQQPLSGSTPPTPATGFTMMPSIVFLPEPSTFVLLGLGVGAVWLLRRRE